MSRITQKFRCHFSALLVFVVFCLGSAVLSTACVTNPYRQKIVLYSQISPVLGLVVDEKYNVLYVEPNSAAELAGVKAQDTLVSLDGIVFQSTTEARKALREIIVVQNPDKSPKRLNLLLRRGGKDTTIVIFPDQLKQTVNPDGKPLPTATPVVQPNDYF